MYNYNIKTCAGLKKILQAALKENRIDSEISVTRTDTYIKLFWVANGELCKHNIRKHSPSCLSDEEVNETIMIILKSFKK
jgi:hypothetical protein